MKNIIITAGIFLLLASCTKQEMPQPAKQTNTAAALTSGVNARTAGSSANDLFVKDPTPTPTPPPPPPTPPAPGPDTPPVTATPVTK